MTAGRVLTVVAVVTIVVLGGAQAGETFSLAAKLLDPRSGQPPAIPSLAGIVADFGSGTKDFTRGSDGRYSADLPPAVTRLSVFVDARDRLAPRTIPLIIGPGTARSLTLYVVERVAVITYDYPAGPILWFESKEWDRALAAFEYAYKTMTENRVSISALRVQVEYYYGLALRRACEFLGYDTCAAAEERFANLRRQRPGNEKYFRGLSSEVLDAAATAAKKIKVTARYDAVVTAYKAGDFNGAAATAEGLLADADAGLVDLSGTNISMDRLRLDAASARARLGDKLMKEDDIAAAVENYKAAVSLSESVELLDKTRALKSAELIRGKLATVERGGV